MKSFFRKAELTDVHLLLELVRDFHEFEHLPFDLEKTQKILNDLIANSSLGQAWIAEVDSEMAGYAVVGFGYSIEYGGRDAFIDELYLAPRFRRKGIGNRFLEWIRDQARTVGVSVIHLEVDLTNDRAFEVYQGFGFKPKARRMMSLWMS